MCATFFDNAVDTELQEELVQRPSGDELNLCRLRNFVGNLHSPGVSDCGKRLTGSTGGGHLNSPRTNGFRSNVTKPRMR